MAKKNGSRASGPRGQKRALTPTQAGMLNEMLFNDAVRLVPNAMRDHAIFRTAICSMLRAGDLMSLKVRDVWSSELAVVRDEIIIQQDKTERNVRCYLQENTRTALTRLLVVRFTQKEPIEHLCRFLDQPLFGITERQYSRIVKGWVRRIGLDPQLYSTHSLRRTKAVEIFRVTKNLEVVRQLLGQTSLGATSAYLGISQEDALTISKEIKL